MTEPNNLIDQTAPVSEVPPQAAQEAPSAAVQPNSAELSGSQTWYLLNCLAAAPDRQLKWGDIKRKGIIKKARELLQLTEENAELLLGGMKQKGQVQTSEKRGTVVYELTDAGEQHLSTLPPPAEFADMAVVVPVSEEVLRYQHACLLLDLLGAPEQTLQKAQANARISRQVQADLQLTPAVANVRRVQLAKLGYIEIDKQGRQEAFHLTADGRDYLAALEQHPDSEFRIRGDTINKLLATAKETPTRESASPTMSESADMPAERRMAELPEGSAQLFVQ